MTGFDETSPNETELVVQSRSRLWQRPAVCEDDHRKKLLVCDAQQHIVFLRKSIHILEEIDFHDSLYGRVEVLENLSSEQLQKITHTNIHYISYRPNKRFPHEPPLSFVMGPSLLSKVKHCESFHQLAYEVLGFSTAYNEAQSCFVFKLLDAGNSMIEIRPGTIKGLCELLSFVHKDAAERMSLVAPWFEQELPGESKFDYRLNYFQDYWKEWKHIAECMWHGRCFKPHPDCGCQYMTFDDYCHCFDSVYDCSNPFKHEVIVLTRKMMYLMINCNEYFGFDGYTYNGHSGKRTGEEFLVVNRPVVTEVLYCDDL